MSVSKQDVRREHDTAMARLDAEQLKALKRINQAFMKARFANASATEMLEEEAAARAAASGGQAG